MNGADSPTRTRPSSAGMLKLGRVLVSGHRQIWHRNFDLSKGRSAALRHFGSQRNSREVRP